MKTGNRIVQDISMLYELSLSIGTSMDLYENCEKFFKILISRKNLTFASVWISSKTIQSDGLDTYQVLHVSPRFRMLDTQMEQDHFIIQTLKEHKAPFSISHSNPVFPQLIQEHGVENKGAFVVYPLKQIGFLKLYASQRQTVFEKIEVAQLKSVVNKFATSIEACISHHQLREETQRRINIQRRLRDNEIKLKLIFNTALDAVVTINEKGIITDWNTQAHKVFGFSPEDAIGQELGSLIIPHQHREAHTRGMKHFLKTGEGPVLNKRIEITAINRTGLEFPIELSIVPLQQENGYFFSAFLRDISKRKEAEQKKEELLEELEYVNGELRDFAYIVSHDLKAPLRAISALSYWIEEDYGELIGEEGQQQLVLLQGRVNRMHALIEGILEYSRIGRIRIKMEALDLNQSLDDILDSLNPPPNFEVRRVKTFPTINCERVRIEQVFQNLISNAIKYNDKEQGWVELDWIELDDHFQFSVKDNGQGIDEKHFEKIFQIFQTLHAKDKYESTGIGLTIVKRIIERHEGKIWVESQPNNGTTFAFTIKKY